MQTSWSNKIFSVILLVFLLLLSASYINFRIIKVDNIYRDDFENKLITSIQDESFYIKDLTPFSWDKMFIIRPYTSKTEMQNIVGIKWTTAHTYLSYLWEKTYFGEYPLDDDRFQKLVFVKGNKVILDITIDREVANFTQIDAPVDDNDLLIVKRTPYNGVIISPNM